MFNFGALMAILAIGAVLVFALEWLYCFWIEWPFEQ